MKQGLINLNGKDIKVQGVGINNQLTSKQKALLELIHDCLKKNEPLNWESMILFYSKQHGFPQYTSFIDYEWRGENFIRFRREEWTDIMLLWKQYEEKGIDYKWTYKWKPRIRQFFATNIGSMVLKGSIIALPVIELE